MSSTLSPPLPGQQERFQHTPSLGASFALVLLSSPPSFSTGSSTPTVAPRPYSVKENLSTGCKQGDTFGSLLYAVGFQSTLLAVQDALAIRIQDLASGGSTTGEVSAFIDDTALFVDGRIADFVAHDTISIFTAAGISLCIDKCRFLVPPGPSSRPPASLLSLLTTTDA